MTLEQLRIRKGMTITQLAAAVGVDRTLISKLESGKRKSCRPDTMMRVCEVLGVKPDDVVEFVPMLVGKELPVETRDLTGSLTSTGATTPALAFTS